MDTHPETPSAGPQPQPPAAAIRVFGLGNAGINVVEELLRGGLPAAAFVAVNSEPASLARSSAAAKIPVPADFVRSVLARGSNLPADAPVLPAQLTSLCAGAEAVFILAGLGGSTGTALCPLLARAAKEAGALAVAFVTMPFDCEASRRQALAQQGLVELKAAADGVICLPNQRISQLIDENTSLLDTFKRSTELLADGVRGIWRLLMHKGLIELHFEDLCEIIRSRHAESSFAVAEGAGPTRSREVLDKLLAHPLLDGGRILGESEAVLVSLIGGPDLTMAEVNRVMEEITRKCPQAQVRMGAAIDEAFRERLAVTLIAAQDDGGGPAGPEPRSASSSESLDSQLLNRAPAARPESRLLPPPPSLSPDRMEQMLAQQGGRASRGRRTGPKLRQTQLPLEIVSKGRFDKSEPTIHKGEDLDVPTYIRRGVALN